MFSSSAVSCSAIPTRQFAPLSQMCHVDGRLLNPESDRRTHQMTNISATNRHKFQAQDVDHQQYLSKHPRKLIFSRLATSQEKRSSAIDWNRHAKLAARDCWVVCLRPSQTHTHTAGSFPQSGNGENGTKNATTFQGIFRWGSGPF
jgi:hypothetical protein